jgi:hypothetical protein
MRRLQIRHFDHGDIEARTELLMDAAFRRNIVHLGARTPTDELRASQARTIEEEYEAKIIFVVSTGTGATLGFTWITSIDWVNRTCELSIALLAQFRRSYGLLALIEMYDYLYDEMNFETVINQILVGNEMLMSDDAAHRSQQVQCANDSFTDGAFRDSRYWTQTRQQHQAFVTRTQARNARIRARVGDLSPRPVSA